MTAHCQVNFEIIQNQKSLDFDTVPKCKYNNLFISIIKIKKVNNILRER